MGWGKRRNRTLSGVPLAACAELAQREVPSKWRVAVWLGFSTTVTDMDGIAVCAEAETGPARQPIPLLEGGWAAATRTHPGLLYESDLKSDKTTR